ncbi:MAG: translation initiation factor IF-2 [Planctomycetaceae bacterium]|nr:translation initiation factor IF-2 [Planctomycetaceae bacterium]
MRLHELAKKHGYNQQDLLTAVQKQGFDVKDTLTVVEDDVEKWVAEKAVDGWIPPPPAKKKAAKKKVMVVPPVAEAPAEADAAAPAAAEAEAPAETAPAPVAERKKTVRDQPAPEPAPEPEAEAAPQSAPTPEAGREEAPVRAEAPAAPQPARPEPEAAAPAAPESPAAPEPVKEAPPPVVVKRINKPVKGSAAVGQASPEMIAQLKRQAAAAAKGEDERRTKRRPVRSAAPAARGPAKVEPVMPDTDLSTKPALKRPKTKGRPTADEEREAAEKKVRQVKKTRGRGGEEDWGIDDEPDFVDAPEEAVVEEVAPDQIDQSLLATASEEDRGGAGFKHKRADFKSKRIQHELPASFAEIDNEFTRSIAGGGRRRGNRKNQRRVVGRRGRTRRFTQPIPRAADQEAVVRLGMTVRDISIALGVKLQEIVGYMLGQGQMVQVNDILSEDYITLIADHFKIPLKWESDEDLEEELAQEAQQQAEVTDESELVERPPVVTFMGHVDHGKTSLLDAIRNTRVVDGEHGGITQHIGAYSVLRNGKRVTFLDTPGHEAFSAMRARGANLTDIAVLVVAADDGVMPQTEEAAAHAKNAGVPIVVAINKCDLPSANPDRVRQELANRLGLLPEEWGGQVGMVEVSAHTKEGMNELVERVLLEAEVLELRANPTRPATGFVVEAKMAEGQGVVATLLVTDGTLHNGDVILSSNGYGKIRFMYDEFGRPIESADPGTPVRMSGLSAVPEAGDKFFILSDLLKARAIAEQRERESRQAAMARRQHVTLENLTSHLAGSGMRELSVIIKADVVGSLEVIEKTLRDMATDEVGVSIIHSAIGGINHADVILADASDAIILGFHVGVEGNARNTASSLGVQIKTYHIIYRMIEDMRAALEGLLPPEEREIVQGHVEIRQVFRSSKVGAIAGCYVVDGQIQRTNRIRLYRSNVVIYDGTIASLKRVKDDAREVKAGFECGIKIANYDAIEEGDMIEAYSIEEVARKL